MPLDGTLKIDYEFYTVPDSLDVYYGGVNIFSSGLVAHNGEFLVPYGPGSENSVTLIMNQNGVVGPPSNWDLVVTVPEPGCLSFVALASLLTFTRKWRKPQPGFGRRPGTL